MTAWTRPYGRPAATRAAFCNAPGGTDYLCSAAVGHAPLDHAAYGSDLNAPPLHTWPAEPQETLGFPTIAEQAAKMHRAAYIEGLRQLAFALEFHPELPLPYEGNGTAMSFHFLFGDDPRTALAAAARALPCTLAKNVRSHGDGRSQNYLDMTGQLAGLKIELTAYRDDVCTRRVTGTEKREVQVEVRPAETRTEVQDVEIVEWDCEPILAPAKAGNGAAA